MNRSEGIFRQRQTTAADRFDRMFWFQSARTVLFAAEAFNALIDIFRRRFQLRTGKAVCRIGKETFGFDNRGGTGKSVVGGDRRTAVKTDSALRAAESVGGFAVAREPSVGRRKFGKAGKGAEKRFKVGKQIDFRSGGVERFNAQDSRPEASDFRFARQNGNTVDFDGAAAADSAAAFGGKSEGRIDFGADLFEKSQQFRFRFDIEMVNIVISFAAVNA